MKFGKLDHIEGLDWRLPELHPQSSRVFSGGRTTTSVYSGGTMWNIPEWIGKVYPPKTPKKNFLKEYAKQFSTIELNATHYRTPTQQTVSDWLEQSAGTIKFCPKFPQSISHYRRFSNCESITDEFLEAILNFKESLSFSFIQLPENLGLSRQKELLNYLRYLPRDMNFALELRHSEWFQGSASAEEVWSAMEELNITSIVSDTGGRRDAVHMRFTTPNIIVRFGGNNLHASDYERLNDWIRIIEGFANNGLIEFQLWMHQTNSLLTPETLIYFSQALKKQVGIFCQAPTILAPDTLDLFSH